MHSFCSAPFCFLLRALACCAGPRLSGPAHPFCLVLGISVGARAQEPPDGWVSSCNSAQLSTSVKPGAWGSPPRVALRVFEDSVRLSVQSRTTPRAYAVSVPINASCYCYCWVVAPRGAFQVPRPVLGGGLHLTSLPGQPSYLPRASEKRTLVLGRLGSAPTQRQGHGSQDVPPTHLRSSTLQLILEMEKQQRTETALPT